jgi:hypothetical protein
MNLHTDRPYVQSSELTSSILTIIVYKSRVFLDVCLSEKPQPKALGEHAQHAFTVILVTAKQEALHPFGKAIFKSDSGGLVQAFQ